MSSLQENIDDFIARCQSRLIDTMDKIGGLPPMYSVLAVETVDGVEKYKDCLIPVPNEALTNDATKDQMIEMLPFVVSQLVDANMSPVCISWCSEAWLRKAPVPKDGEKIEDSDWKSLPKTEAAIMCVESEKRSDMIVYDLERSGSKITPDGDMIDNVVLKLNEELNTIGQESKTLEGRFQNVFKSVQDAFRNRKS